MDVNVLSLSGENVSYEPSIIKQQEIRRLLPFGSNKIFIFFSSFLFNLFLTQEAAGKNSWTRRREIVFEISFKYLQHRRNVIDLITRWWGDECHVKFYDKIFCT